MSTIRIEFLFETGDVRAPLRVTNDALGRRFSMTHKNMLVDIDIPQHRNDFLFWQPFIPNGYSALLKMPGSADVAILVMRVSVTITETNVIGSTAPPTGENLQEAVALADRAKTTADEVIQTFIGWVRATTRMSDLPLSSVVPSLAGPARMFDLDSGLPVKTGPGLRTYGYGRDPRGKYQLSAVDIEKIVELIQSPSEIPVAETLLADAEYYVRHVISDFRRAVLMAAIACEVKVKTVLRAAVTEDKRPLLDFALDSPREITITAASGLFHKLMKATTSRSLSDEDNKLFRDIEKLYKIRNDIAHQGKMPDEAQTRLVVRAARKCFVWLDDVSAGKEVTSSQASGERR